MEAYPQLRGQGPGDTGAWNPMVLGQPPNYCHQHKESHTCPESQSHRQAALLTQGLRRQQLEGPAEDSSPLPWGGQASLKSSCPSAWLRGGPTSTRSSPVGTCPCSGPTSSACPATLAKEALLFPLVQGHLHDPHTIQPCPPMAGAWGVGGETGRVRPCLASAVSA